MPEPETTSRTPGHPARSLGQTLSRWASQDRDEARELRQDTAQGGAALHRRCAADREKVVLQGTLKTVTLRPRGGVPALEAELYDGSGSINVIWLGRRRISGICPGRSIRVAGRIGEQDGDRIMFNPRYDLRFAVTRRPHRPQTVEQVVRQQLSQALGGVRGMLEAAVPTIMFTVVFLTRHDLRLAIALSLATAAVLLVVRLVQRSSPQVRAERVLRHRPRRAVRLAGGARRGRRR